jgi:hypothetical protein
MSHDIWQPVSHDDPRQTFADLTDTLNKEAAREVAVSKLVSPVRAVVELIPKVLRTGAEDQLSPRGNKRLSEMHPVAGPEGSFARVVSRVARILLVRSTSS